MRRWSHSAIGVGESAVIFGGFGVDRASAQNTPDQRLHSVALWHAASGRVSLPRIGVGSGPVARERHTAVRCGERAEMLVFGGRTNPLHVLNDCWLLAFDGGDGDDAECRWYRVDDEHAAAPSPVARYRHAACWTHRGMLVHGGCTAAVLPTESVAISTPTSAAPACSEQEVCGDVWLLKPPSLHASSSTWSWRALQCTGDVPPPRHSHTLTCVGNTVYAFGGFGCGGVHSNPADTSVYALDVDACVWTRIECAGALPAARYSAAAASVDERFLVVVGGCSVDDPVFNQISILDTHTSCWFRPSVVLPPVMLCKHAVAIVGDQLVIFGGGALCFSFGACFNDVIALDMVRTNATLDFRLATDAASQLLIEQSVAADVDDAAAASVAATVALGDAVAACSVCGAAFASRNQLNKHIVALTHRRQ